MLSNNAMRVVSLAKNSKDELIGEIKKNIENAALKLALNNGIPITRKELAEKEFILTFLKTVIEE